MNTLYDKDYVAWAEEFPSICPFTLEEALDEDYLPRRLNNVPYLASQGQKVCLKPAGRWASPTKVKLILPALTEALSPHWRPIKCLLSPPLRLSAIASFFSQDDDITLQDEHVEPLNLEDEPNFVVIQVYITPAARAYEPADHYGQRGAYIRHSTLGCLG